jgi:hypothetical protein
MKKHLLLAVLCLCLSSIVYGQKKYIALRDTPPDSTISGFFIKMVVDSRPATDSIGYFFIGAESRKVPIDLARGLTDALSNYLKIAVPRDAGDLPVILGVDELSLTPAPSGADQELEVLLQASFYQQRERYKVLLFETQVSVTGQEPPEALIRQALAQALNEFSNTNWDNPDAGTPVTEERLKKRLDQQEQKVIPLNLLLFGYAAGNNATGWKFSYYRSSKSSHEGWFFPWRLSGEFLQIESQPFARSGIVEARLNYGMFGICPFREISDRVYVNLDLMLLVGAETLTDRIDRQSTNLLLGLAPKQTLYYIPNSRFGLVIGFGLYQRLLTSEVYQSDFGFQIEAGFKF